MFAKKKKKGFFSSISNTDKQDAADDLAKLSISTNVSKSSTAAASTSTSTTPQRVSTSSIPQTAPVTTPTVPATAPTATQPTPTAASGIEAMTLNELFERYLEHSVDEEGNRYDVVTADGLFQYTEDLGVDAMDVIVLLLLWKLQSTEKYELTSAQFVNGWRNLSIDSLRKMREYLPRLRRELDDKHKMKEFYSWVFKYLKNPQAKCLEMQMAVDTWKLILAHLNYEHLDAWCDFILHEYKKAVMMDTWDMFLDFATTVKDFDEFDADGAWPLAIDEFVEFMIAKRSAGRSAAAATTTA